MSLPALTISCGFWTSWSTPLVTWLALGGLHITRSATGHSAPHEPQQQP